MCYAGTTTTTTTTTTTAAPTTTTTTSGGGGTILVANYGGFGASIDSFTPTWFIIDTGSIPVTSGGVASGTHSGYIGNIGIDVSGATSYNLSLYVNSISISTIAITSDGLYTFTGVTITSSDNVDIKLEVPA